MKHEEKLESFHFYRSLKLEKYGFGLKTSGFVSFLAWSGMMFGILGILISLIFTTDFDTSYDLFFRRLDLVIPYNWLFYIGGIVGILTSTTWLGLSVALWDRNVNKDFQGIRRILQIQCFITGSFEIILSIMGIIVVILLTTPVVPIIQNWFCGLGFLLVFACFKIHGVRTDNNRFIKSYMVFNMINFVLCVAVYIYLCQDIDIQLSFVTIWGLFTFGVIVFPFVFIYYMGPLVVLYNFNHHFDSNFYNVNLAFSEKPVFDPKFKAELVK